MQTCPSRTQTTPIRRPQSTPRSAPVRPGANRSYQSRRTAPPAPPPAVAVDTLPEKFLGLEEFEEDEEYVQLAPDCLAQVYDAVPLAQTQQSKRCCAARRVGQRPSCTARYVPSVPSRYNANVPRSYQSCCVDERLGKTDSLMMKESTAFDDLDEDVESGCRGRSCC